MNGRIQRAHSVLEQELERAPSTEELAEVMNMDLEDLTTSLAIGNRHVSLDVPIGQEEDSTLMDTLENPNAENTEGNLYHSDSLKTEINRSMSVLTERQKETLCYFFGIGIDRPMSLEDIGEKFHLTPERVRQIKDKAITKLRTTQNFDLLRSYLGA